MNENTARWAAVALGVALIATYSALMIATEGTSGWSWILLVAGIGSLVLGEHDCSDATPDHRRRHKLGRPRHHASTLERHRVAAIVNGWRS